MRKAQVRKRTTSFFISAVFLFCLVFGGLCGLIAGAEGEEYTYYSDQVDRGGIRGYNVLHEHGWNTWLWKLEAPGGPYSTMCVDQGITSPGDNTTYKAVEARDISSEVETNQAQLHWLVSNAYDTFTVEELKIRYDIDITEYDLTDRGAIAALQSALWVYSNNKFFITDPGDVYDSGNGITTSPPSILANDRKQVMQLYNALILGVEEGKDYLSIFNDKDNIKVTLDDSKAKLKPVTATTKYIAGPYTVSIDGTAVVPEDMLRLLNAMTEFTLNDDTIVGTCEFVDGHKASLSPAKVKAGDEFYVVFDGIYYEDVAFSVSGKLIWKSAEVTFLKTTATNTAGHPYQSLMCWTSQTYPKYVTVSGSLPQWPEDSNTMKLQILKTDDSEEPIPLKDIEFTLTYPDGKEKPKFTESDGTASWCIDALGTYTLTEKLPENSTLIPIDELTFEVTLADIESGDEFINLTYFDRSVEGISYDDESNTIIIVNQKMLASLALEATKKANRAMTDGQFTFTLYESDEEGAEGDVVLTAVNAATAANAAGSFIFDEIIYDSERDYYYILKETAGGGSNWSRDSAQYWIQVRVEKVYDEDNNQASLAVTGVTYQHKAAAQNEWSGEWLPYVAEEVVFVNSYYDGGGGYTGDDDADDDDDDDGDDDTDTDADTDSDADADSDFDSDTDSDSDSDTDFENPVNRGETRIVGQPVATAPGNNLVADGDGWIEVDENNVPLGRWSYDPDEDVWLFDPITPLAGALPQTGVAGEQVHLLVLAGLYFTTAGVILQTRNRKRGKHEG